MQREFQQACLADKDDWHLCAVLIKWYTYVESFEYSALKSIQITLFINLITDWYHWWWEGGNVQKASDGENKPPWPGGNGLAQCWCGDVYCFYDFILCMQIKESKLSKYIIETIYDFSNIKYYLFSCYQSSYKLGFKY